MFNRIASRYWPVSAAVAILTVWVGGLACSSGSQTPNPPPPPVGPIGKVTVEQVANMADSILVGKVTDIAGSEDKGKIYTRVTLSVEQTIKGETLQQAVVQMPGGESGGLKMMVTDTPKFQMGERVVVFLNKGEGIFTFAGGLYGKFTIDANNMVGGVPLDEFINQVKAGMSEQEQY